MEIKKLSELSKGTEFETVIRLKGGGILSGPFKRRLRKGETLSNTHCKVWKLKEPLSQSQSTKMSLDCDCIVTAPPYATGETEETY